MKKKAKKKNSSLVIGIIIAVVVVIVLFLFMQKKGESPISETAKTIPTNEDGVREYLSIEPGDYQDILSQRASLTVTFDNKIYNFEINWASSAYENTKWTFSGKFDKKLNGVPYDNCVCVNEFYDEKGNRDEEGVYEGGSGLMKLDTGKLLWIDESDERIYDDNYNGIFEKVVSGYTNTFGLPEGVHYFISGYDREASIIYNGEPMMTRLPIIGGDDFYKVNVANGLVKPSYESILNWCENNLMTSSRVKNVYLNYASIKSQTQNEIVLVVNCAIQRGGVINGNVQFENKFDLINNRYEWEKIEDKSTTKKYIEIDEDGTIIITTP